MRTILLKTTLQYAEDDWHMGRFSKLINHLTSLRDEADQPLYRVIARDRVEDAKGIDLDLLNLTAAHVDQLWLFALDTEGVLKDKEITAIETFRVHGGGLLLTRDHQDMGVSLLGLGVVGQAHHFHSANPELDTERCVRDDCHTTSIDWPNYHSGANGDYQTITPVEPIHPLLHAPHRPDGVIYHLPAHPHEGAISVPTAAAEYARVVATGKSQVSGHTFNLAIAFDPTGQPEPHRRGRVVCQSTFHHFADYNWDPAAGCPSFVTEPQGDGMVRDPEALADVHAYCANLAEWLGERWE